MNQDPESLTSDIELDDLHEQTQFNFERLDLQLLRNPVVVRALAGVIVATLVLAWPERTDRILARLIGLAVLSVAVPAVLAALKSKPTRWISAAFGAIGAAIGALVVIFPNQSDQVLGLVVGGAILVAAARDIYRVLQQPDDDSRGWLVSRSVAMIGFGLILVAFPSDVFSAATSFIAIGWIALSLLVIVVSLDNQSSGVSNYTDSTRLIAEWLEERPKSVDDRQALYDKILYEGPQTGKRIGRFFVLMGFASVIASMGVITDSTAVVIGAMLIAPLMTPLMAIAISLVMGWPRRLVRAASVAAGGIVFAIVIGVLLGLVAPGVIDAATNGQIIARSSPTGLDVITAVAAGAAGAYGLSRPDVSDSLPGVAIAISLVPPLSVVGISYSQGEWSAGNGALLLFMINMLAILVMGGLTFIVTGVTPVRRVAENQHRVRSYLAGVGALAALVFGALLLTGTQTATNLFEQSSVETAVNQWLDDHPQHSLVRVDLEGDTVTAVIVGPSEDAPLASTVASDLRNTLGRSVTADVRLIVEEREIVTVD